MLLVVLHTLDWVLFVFADLDNPLTGQWDLNNIDVVNSVQLIANNDRT